LAATTSDLLRQVSWRKDWIQVSAQRFTYVMMPADVAGSGSLSAPMTVGSLQAA
jgi:hypothetical protein